MPVDTYAPTHTPSPAATGAGAAAANPKTVGMALLWGAALFWGMGFYAQKLSLDGHGALWATALRFVLAVPIAVAVLVWRRSKGVPLPWRAGALLGVLLYAAFALQTIAMLTTPVARVALLTGLYAVLTPLLQPLFRLGRPSAVQVAAAGLAAVGTMLLCGLLDDDSVQSVPLNIGDLLTLGMALLSAVMVLLVARMALRDDALALNSVQVVVMALLGTATAMIWEQPLPNALTATNGLALAYLAVFSTFLAFSFQMIAQRSVQPATAAVIMILEVPIGVAGAVWLLDESMTWVQWLGGAIAFVAVVIAVRAERAAPPPTPAV